MKFCDKFKFSGKKPKQGSDYVETKDTFTILNVPILAEMVQNYGSDKVLKSKDEILKVEVNNVPLTLVDSVPSHPEDLVSLDTFEKKDVVIGFMSEPARPRDNLSSTKRYADFVLYNVPKIDALKTTYLDGTIIDTSIGFDCVYEETTGKFQGTDYDWIQRNIVLDHNAILIDRYGRIATGRMPAPIGGIGADKGDHMKTKDADINGDLQKLANQITSDNPDLNLEQAYELMGDLLWKIRNPGDSNNGGDTKMVDDKKTIDALTKENADMKKKLEDQEKVIADSKTAAADKKPEEGKDIKKDLDAAKMESDKLKLEMKDVKDELVKSKEDLKVHTDKEKEALDKKLDSLKEHYGDDFKEVLDKSEPEFINKKFDELQKKEDKKDIGADMFGAANASKYKKEQERFDKVYNPKKKDEEGK